MRLHPPSVLKNRVTHMMKMRWFTVCGFLLGMLLSGCEETKEYTPPPLPPIRNSDPEPEPEKPEPTPEPVKTTPAPEPEPMPPTPPPRKCTAPTFVWHKREWTPVGTGSRRGIGFSVIYRMINDPDQLKMRVILENNRGNTIEVATKRIGDYVGIEYFAAGATEVEAPFKATIEYHDPEADLWLPVVKSSPLDRK